MKVSDKVIRVYVGEILKPSLLNEVTRLNNILKHTRKRRIKFKLLNRIHDLTFGCFCQWIRDEEAHKTIDKVTGGIRMPGRVEMVRRYGKAREIIRVRLNDPD